MTELPLSHSAEFRAFSEQPQLGAIWSDAADATPIDLADLWSELCSEGTRIVDTFFTDERCYALLDRSLEPRAALPLIEGRNLEILERVLLGQSQKAVSIEFSLSASSIAAVMSHSLQLMGVRCRASNAPVLLVIAAHAAQGPTSGVDARITRLQGDHGTLWVVSARRPDLSLPPQLSKAELEVVRRLVEGSSHAQISCARGTSDRTIANQLGAIFRKLRVSGRAELLSHLVARAFRTDASLPIVQFAPRLAPERPRNASSQVTFPGTLRLRNPKVTLRNKRQLASKAWSESDSVVVGVASAKDAVVARIGLSNRVFESRAGR